MTQWKILEQYNHTDYIISIPANKFSVIGSWKPTASAGTNGAWALSTAPVTSCCWLSNGCNYFLLVNTLWTIGRTRVEIQIISLRSPLLLWEKYAPNNILEYRLRTYSSGINSYHNLDLHILFQHKSILYTSLLCDEVSAEFSLRSNNIVKLISCNYEKIC